MLNGMLYILPQFARKQKTCLSTSRVGRRWLYKLNKIIIHQTPSTSFGTSWVLRGEESACNVESLGSIPGLGRSPGEGHGNPLQYSRLENPHGQRSLAGYSVLGFAKSRTRLSD